MSMWRDLAFRLHKLAGRTRRESELDEELRFHLEMEVERRMAAGQDRAAAERAARLDFGAPESVKEAVRDVWGTRLLEETVRDVRGALRQFAEAPTFALAAIGSLGVGLGAAAVIFSLVDAVMLRPLPYGEPERVVAFFELTPQGDRFSLSDRNFADFRRELGGFEHLAAVAFPPPRPALGGSGERRRLDAQAVTPSFFSVLGVDARLGRTFDSSAEERVSVPREVVLTDGLWRRELGADENVLGQEIDLDGELYTVIGVLPQSFRFGSPVDVFLPYVADMEVNRGDHRLSGFGRLAPGVSLEQAEQEAVAMAARLAEEFPDSNARWSAELVPIEQYFLGGGNRRLHQVLLGAVALLLILAAVNVSSLLLARAADRSHEFRLRLALGAGGWRLVRQLMSESILLGLFGVACAFGLAWLAVPVVASLDVPLPRLDEMRLDGRVFAFLAAGGLLQSLLFGLAPALRLSRTPAGGLAAKQQGGDLESQRLRSSLVIAEVALATVLTLGAGLLLHSFDALSDVDSGFPAKAENVLLAQIDLPQARYPEDSVETRQLYRGLLEAMKALPGVSAAGLTTTSPFAGPDLRNNVAPEQEKDRDKFVPIHWRATSEQLFRALGIPLVRGRSFDDAGEPRPEAVISERLAARLWPGEDPIGRRMRWIGPEGPVIEIVGVAGEVRDVSLAKDEQLTVYLPQQLMGWPMMTLAVRGSVDAEVLGGAVRAAIQDLDPILAMPPITRLSEQRRAALGQPLLGLSLLSASAFIALVLASIGVYGLLAYTLARRRREIGVRVALGARPGELFSMVAGDGLRLIGVGLCGGIVMALLAAESLRAVLFATSPFEPAVVAGVAILLVAVGLASSGLPAWRAARVDPVWALREE